MSRPKQHESLGNLQSISTKTKNATKPPTAPSPQQKKPRIPTTTKPRIKPQTTKNQE